MPGHSWRTHTPVPQCPKVSPAIPVSCSVPHHPALSPVVSQSLPCSPVSPAVPLHSEQSSGLLSYSGFAALGGSSCHGGLDQLQETIPVSCRVCAKGASAQQPGQSAEGCQQRVGAPCAPGSAPLPRQFSPPEAPGVIFSRFPGSASARPAARMCREHRKQRGCAASPARRGGHCPGPPNPAGPRAARKQHPPGSTPGPAQGGSWTGWVGPISPPRSPGWAPSLPPRGVLGGPHCPAGSRPHGPAPTPPDGRSLFRVQARTRRRKTTSTP